MRGAQTTVAYLDVSAPEFLLLLPRDVLRDVKRQAAHQPTRVRRLEQLAEAPHVAQEGDEVVDKEYRGVGEPREGRVQAGLLLVRGRVLPRGWRADGRRGQPFVCCFGFRMRMARARARIQSYTRCVLCG